eukprot:7524439-Pyramimonas_sp.AAC.1
MAPELAYRASSTSSSLQALRQVAFPSPQLSVQHKLQLAAVLVMSGRLYDAATWPQHTWAQFNRYRDGTIKTYRSALGKPAYDDGAEPASAILAAACKCAVDSMMRWHRLRYLSCLYRQVPGVLFGLIRATAEPKHSWFNTVLEDLRWLRTRVSRLRKLPSPYSEFGLWEKEILGRGQHWANLVLSGVEVHIRWSSRIDDARQTTQAPAPVVHRCPFCPFSSPNFAPAKSHIARFHHQQRSVAARYIHRRTCPISLVRFSSVELSIDHIAYGNPNCYISAL